MKEKIIYTVGHSSHAIEYFLELIKGYSINCIVDVRSNPASSFAPQFNKMPLLNSLKRNGISYVHFAKEFGARRTEDELFNKNGQVDFEKVRKTKVFISGVERLRQGIQKGLVIALMCSEANPFDCHRFSMISVELEKHDFTVMHILKDKSLIRNKELERELLKKYEKKIPQPSIFEPDITEEKQLTFAYQLRNKDIAYTLETQNL